MAETSTALANAALANLGHQREITTLATDTTAEAKACRRFYDRVIRQVLAAYPWPFAQKVAALTLVEALTGATDEWAYKYRLPEDCVQPQRLKLAGVRSLRRESQPAFETARDTDSTAWASGTTYAASEYASVTSGSTTTWYRALRETIGDAPASSALDWVAITGTPPQWLFCHLEDAELEYTQLVTDPREFSPGFEAAAAALLAFYVAPSVTKGERDLQARMGALYEAELATATMVAENAQLPEPDPDSDFEAARR